jgi:hypothetical protein
MVGLVRDYAARRIAIYPTKQHFDEGNRFELRKSPSEIIAVFPFLRDSPGSEYQIKGIGDVLDLVVRRFFAAEWSWQDGGWFGQSVAHR